MQNNEYLSNYRAIATPTHLVRLRYVRLDTSDASDVDRRSKSNRSWMSSERERIVRERERKKMRRRRRKRWVVNTRHSVEESEDIGDGEGEPVLGNGQDGRKQGFVGIGRR